MRNWFTMKFDAAKSGAAEIFIYDEIGQSWWGEDTVTAKQFVDDLKALGDGVTEITLRVNSPGGDVFDGIAIHNAVKNHKATVTAHVDGIAASAASYIVMAADKIVMPANSFMLVHGASGFAMGDSKTVRALADDLDRINTSMTATYVARSGKTTKQIEALMLEDRLMSASEAEDLGLCDEVVTEVKLAANYSLRLLPKAAADTIKALMPDEPELTPQPAPEPAPEPEPAPAPIAEPPTNVVDIDAARKIARSEVVAYVKDVHDLCALANLPGEARAFIDAETPIEKVRAALIDKRANADAELAAQHATQQAKAPSASWDKIIARQNARNTRN